jgi:hypothetical protein
VISPAAAAAGQHKRADDKWARADPPTPHLSVGSKRSDWLSGIPNQPDGFSLSLLGFVDCASLRLLDMTRKYPSLSVQHPVQDLSKTDRSIGRGPDTQREREEKIAHPIQERQIGLKLKGRGAKITTQDEAKRITDHTSHPNSFIALWFLLPKGCLAGFKGHKTPKIERRSHFHHFHSRPPQQ